MDDPSQQARLVALVQQRTAELERELEQTRQLSQSQRSTLEMLQAIVDNSIATICVKSADGRYLIVNRRFEELFGVHRDALIGRRDYDLLARQDAERFRRIDEQVMATASRIEFEEAVLLGGELRTYQAVKWPIFGADGKPQAICGISTDITERKQAESRVQAQLERMDLLQRITRAIAERQDLHSTFGTALTTIEEHLPLDFAAICLYDAATQTLTLNRLGLHTHGLSAVTTLVEGMRLPTDSRAIARGIRGELSYEPVLQDATRDLQQHLHAAGIQSLVVAPLLAESAVFGVLLAGRKQPSSFSGSECDFLRQLSEHVALATHQSRLYGALQQAYEDLRKSRQAVLQQERLRALGQMASGIGHDINNAISPVTLYAEWLLEHGNLDDKARDAMLIIQRAVGEVAKTVTRMREFSRPREAQLQLSRINLNDVVLQVIDLTRVRWRDQPQINGHVITVYADLAADLPAILGADSEIRDALINLVFNAIDAMPGGGALTIRTACMLDSPSGKTRGRESVWLEVSDNGAGMDEEVRRHCLEPFYSTKGERGTGLGLGLAMVYGMAQRHNADLEIVSAPGQGTTVKIRFATLGVRTKAAPAQSALLPALPLRILVVDDDPLVIHAMQTALAGDGHDVVTATGGQEAIDAFRSAQAQQLPFDAVFTDLGMPHVDGRQVAAAIKATDPQVRVIMLTGWGQRLLEESGLPAHVDQVLSKPPKLAELRHALAASNTSKLSIGR